MTSAYMLCVLVCSQLFVIFGLNCKVARQQCGYHEPQVVVKKACGAEPAIGIPTPLLRGPLVAGTTYFGDYDNACVWWRALRTENYSRLLKVR